MIKVFFLVFFVFFAGCAQQQVNKPYKIFSDDEKAARRFEYSEWFKRSSVQ